MPQSLKDFIKKLFPYALRERLLPIYHLFRAIFASIYYGFPARGMTIVAVTGTNGKTTTINMIGSIFNAAGFTTGILSSAVMQIGDDWQDLARQLTTEDVFELQKLLRKMKKRGVTHLAMEVSSHALAQNRIWGIPISGAVFTNLSQDHMDYFHSSSMQKYAATKGKLFKKASDFVVLNQDDEWFESFLLRPASMTTTYGHEPTANVVITDEKVTSTGAQATLKTKSKDLKIKLKLQGSFNIANAAAAAATCWQLGIEDSAIKEGLESLASVPGRVESINEGQRFQIIVDHAHTPDAITNLLREIRKSTKGKLIVLLGADGERDRGKRPKMGRICAELADFVVVADQEPYGDPANPIRADILEGVKKDGFEDYLEIPDRRKAIHEALKMAKSGDSVVITGMGNKTTRGLNSGKINWDERQVAREELKKVRAK